MQKDAATSGVESVKKYKPLWEDRFKCGKIGMVENDKWRTEYILVIFFIRSCSMRSSSAIFAGEAYLIISLVVKTPFAPTSCTQVNSFFYIIATGKSSFG